MQRSQLGFALTLRSTAEQLLISGDVEVGAVLPGASHPGITHRLLAAALSTYRSPASAIICSSACCSPQPWPFGNMPSKRKISVCSAVPLVLEKQFCNTTLNFVQ